MVKYPISNASPLNDDFIIKRREAIAEWCQRTGNTAADCVVDVHGEAPELYLVARHRDESNAG